MRVIPKRPENSLHRESTIRMLPWKAYRYFCAIMLNGPNTEKIHITRRVASGTSDEVHDKEKKKSVYEKRYSPQAA